MAAADCGLSRCHEKLGWEDGRNFILDYRFAAGEEGRISAAAKELVALKPDVILGVAPQLSKR